MTQKRAEVIRQHLTSLLFSDMTKKIADINNRENKSRETRGEKGKSMMVISYEIDSFCALDSA